MALVTRDIIAVSSPIDHGPKLSPRSELRSILRMARIKFCWEQASRVRAKSRLPPDWLRRIGKTAAIRQLHLRRTFVATAFESSEALRGRYPLQSSAHLTKVVYHNVARETVNGTLRAGRVATLRLSAVFTLPAHVRAELADPFEISLRHLNLTPTPATPEAESRLRTYRSFSRWRRRKESNRSSAGAIAVLAAADSRLLGVPRRINHPRRDLVRRIGICPASLPVLRVGRRRFLHRNVWPDFRVFCVQPQPFL